jgi:hypothetical protein
MEIKLNLASKPYLNRQRIRLWLLLACSFMLLLLVSNGYYGFQNFRQLRLLESRFLELAGQASGVLGTPEGYTPESYAVVRDEVMLANEIVAADQFRWTVLLSRFEALVPADVSIRTIQPDFKARSVQLTGIARDVSAMTRFVDNLLTSEDLNQAYLQRHGEVKSDPGGISQFHVGFSLVIREAF